MSAMETNNNLCSATTREDGGNPNGPGFAQLSKVCILLVYNFSYRWINPT